MQIRRRIGCVHAEDERELGTMRTHQAYGWLRWTRRLNWVVKTIAARSLHDLFPITRESVIKTPLLLYLSKTVQ
jgi:hypothetical protein